MALAFEIGDRDSHARASVNAARALQYVSEYERAMELLFAALAEYQEIGAVEGEMLALNAIGITYNHLGNLDEALSHYRRSLDLARKAGNVERQAAALNNIGEANSKLGNTSEAHSFFTQALEASDEADSGQLGAVVRVNLGDVERRLGNRKRAERYLTEGASIARELEDLVTEAEALTYLGLLSQDGGDLERAEQLHRQSISVAGRIENETGRITALQNLARCLLAQDREEEALPLLQEAIESGERIRSPFTVREAYPALGDLLQKRGCAEAALDAYKHYASLLQTIHSEQISRSLRALRIQFEQEKARSEAEIYRLRNVELREKTRQLELAYEQLRVISEAGQEITSSLDLDTLTETVYRHVNRLMDASVFGIALYEADEEAIDYALFIDKGERIAPFRVSSDSEESIGVWAIKNRKEVWLNDIRDGYSRYAKRVRYMTAKQTQSLIYVPLQINERVIGVLTVQSYHSHSYTDKHVQMLKALGSYVAIALDNSRAHDRVNQLNAIVLSEKRELEQAYAQISHMANHDNLTGLANRRLLLELLAEYIPMAVRADRRMAVLYIDLDDFKPINDNLGHQSGDEVLSEVAARLRQAVRASDTVARIGGDEFVVLVQNLTERESAGRLAQKIIEAISKPITVGDAQLKVGASIGISIFPDDARNRDDLLNRADEAMYDAKTGGKRTIAFVGEH